VVLSLLQLSIGISSARWGRTDARSKLLCSQRGIIEMATFLLVDDEALVIRCYERLLSETTTTHRVVSARDDSCARQVILDMAERRDLIDVALLDLHLEHDHEGTELIPLLRRLHGGVVVAVMSAYLESSTAYTIQQHFRALAIPKPLSPDLLEALAHDPFGQSREAISGFARAHGLSPREQQVVAAEVAGWDCSGST